MGDWELGARVCVSVPFVSARGDAGSRFRVLESSSHNPLPPGPVQPSLEANLECDTQGRVGKSFLCVGARFGFPDHASYGVLVIPPITSFVAHS